MPHCQSSIGEVPFLQVPGDGFQGHSFFAEQDKQVEEQVGGFVDEVPVGLGQCGDDGLHGFLAHFLGDLVEASAAQAVHVGFPGGEIVPVPDDALQFQEEILVVFGAEAAARAGVAGRANGVRLDEDRVPVAVHVDAGNVKEVAAFLALGPQAVLAPGVERHLSFGLGLFPCLLVHIAQHQDFQRLIVLHDHRDEPVSFFKIYGHLIELRGLGMPARAFHVKPLTGSFSLLFRFGAGFP